MPCRYLLDTNICIYIAKRRPPEVWRRFEQLTYGDVAMSIVTYGELQFGAEKSQYAASAHEKLAKLAEVIPVLSMPDIAAMHYGRIRANLERSGTTIGANDLWIAAHALAAELVLVSNNSGEFLRVPDLRLENWATNST